jgi:hypothetical protein
MFTLLQIDSSTWTIRDQLLSSSGITMLLTTLLTILASLSIVYEQYYKSTVTKSDKILKWLKFYGAIVIIGITLIVDSVQLDADTKSKVKSDKKEKELADLQSKRDKKYNSDVYAELLKLDTTIRLQHAALDTVSSVLTYQGKQLAIANSINVNVDPIDSSFIKPQLILRDSDDFKHLNSKITGNTGEGVPTSGYTEGVFQKVCQASLTDEILSDDAGSGSTAAQNIIRR